MWDQAEKHKRLITEAALRHKLNPADALAFAQFESAGTFSPTVKNPRSSATGFFQFMPTTWRDMGGTDENRLDPRVQAELGAKYLAQNRAALAKALKREVQPHELYLGHQLGARGAQAMLTADPNTPAEQVIATYDPKRAKEIARLNGWAGKSAGEGIEAYRRRFGGTFPTAEGVPVEAANVGRGGALAPQPTAAAAPIASGQAAPSLTGAPAANVPAMSAAQTAAAPTITPTAGPTMPTIAMQTPMTIERGGFTAADANTERAKILRQRAMAEALQKQAIGGYETQYTPGGMAVAQSPGLALVRALTLGGAQYNMNGADQAEKGVETRYSDALSKALDQLNKANTPREAPYGYGQTGGLDGPAGDGGQPQVIMPNPENVKSAAGELARVSGGQQDVAKAMLANALAGKVPKYDTKPQYDQNGRAFIVAEDGSMKYLGGVQARDKMEITNTGGQTIGVNPYSGKSAPIATNTNTPDAVLRSDTDKQIAGQNNARQQAQQAIGNVDDLRKEYNSAPPVKDWTTVQPVLQSAREAMRVNTSAADLNLIYAFAKTMDPGSVVRESETKMAGGTGSYWDRAQGLWASVVGGQRLTPEVRQALMAEIESRGKGLELSAAAVRQQIEGVARARNLPLEQIIGQPAVQAKDRPGAGWKVLGVEKQNGASGAF